MWKNIANWVKDLILSGLIALVVILFLYQPVKVEGTSMMPGLEDNERVFINKYLYRFGLGEVERGDTVVFWFPADPTKSFIKRIIGLPGDMVDVRAGVVFLNGRMLDEPYVPEQYRDQLSVGPIRVPDGEFFVLGDHRSSSNDSRHWGAVPRAAIYGKAVFAYWPPERLGVLR